MVSRINHQIRAPMDPDTVDKLLQSLEKSSSVLSDLQSFAHDSSVVHGLMLQIPNPPGAYKAVPVTLLPTFVHGPALEKIVQIQNDINFLIHRISHDNLFLPYVLAGAAAVDEFTKKLLEMHNQINPNSQWHLGLFRSDYLLHCSQHYDSRTDILRHADYKMVEVNTICVGLAGTSSFMPDIHRGLLQVLDIPAKDDAFSASGESLTMYGRALSTAHVVYCQEYPGPHPKYLLIVVHDGFEFNVVDQRLIQKASGLRTLRRTFSEILKTMRVTEEGILFVEDVEVAVVYYRTGYSPDQYAGDEDWKTRTLLESSRAIKCPSVAYQLAGAKKVQQELGQPSVLKRFLPTSYDQLATTFVGQWDLSDSSSMEAVNRALINPETYVLKPNREGGGNNLYGKELISKIHEVRGTKHAAGYILMDKILAPHQRNILLRPDRPAELTDTINEVSVFGTILAKNDTVVLNSSASQILVRSKDTSVNEGGLATGGSCLSSSYVI